MPTQLWRTTSTGGDDFIVLDGAGTSVNGGTGHDLIVGDGPPPFQFGTTNSLMSPANLDSPLYWSTIENPLFGDASMPHTSLFVRTDAGQMHYGSVTVGAGETIIIDIDFGNYTWVGDDVDVYVTLYDSTGAVLATNDDAAYFLQEGGGSVSVNDSYLVYTNETASAQTYTIGFSQYSSGSSNPFTGGQTFVANISVSAHGTSAAEMSNDSLVGGDGNDTLIGQGGDDLLYGRAGFDDLFGGSGNDLLDGGELLDTAWYIDASSGVTVDLRNAGPQNTGGAGIDTLVDIEYLVGSTHSDTLLGNNDFNNLRGGAGSDLLLGNGGQDLLYGEAGEDTIFGGDGDDILRGEENNYSSYSGDTMFGEDGLDTIYGWLGNDRIYGGDGNDQITEAGGDDIIDGGAGEDQLLYWGGSGPITVNLSLITAQVTGQGTDTITGIENVTGTSGDDIITGNGVANLLNGWWGSDTLNGGGGDDRLIGDDGNDTLNGGAGSDTADFSSVAAGVTVNLAITTAQVTGHGSDTLESIENLIGSLANDVLYGSTGANRIEGFHGDDHIRGQGGDDTLFGDDGNDTLLGGNGNDVLNGGAGVDTASYAGHGSGVTVSLTNADAQDTGQGMDTLAGIENLIGTAFADTLTGDTGANRLNGGAGADTMRGGDGNDVYIVDNAGDVVSENAGRGNDLVQSSVSFSLDANVERLTLTGSGNTNAVGNSAANVLTGNSGNNIIVGGLGNDTLSGGAGNDMFRFNSALNPANNVDTITDFDSGNDEFQLDDDIFVGIGGTGTLAAGAFRVGTAAGDSNDRIIYDPATGSIYFDSDGTGSAAAVLFAKVDPMLILSNADFSIIG